MADEHDSTQLKHALDFNAVIGNRVIQMQHAISRRTKLALLCAAIAVATAPGAALAQSGSAGGSIGNDEKSLSGSRPTPRSAEPDQPARRGKPASDEPRRTTSRKSGGGGGSGAFDGAWTVVSVGCGGTSTSAVIVSSGRIIGQGVTGTVSANGYASSVTNADGIVATGSGRVSGRSGSGTFRRSDGCSGRWTSSKQ
jgi:hypothetical protein